ncbi:uncharacterized protein LOC141708819 [Apium graveolens]|uniref:uncharacterized protein LOC141708819 n=1 Tax=Apium graveolens TaxID=4045 RepID=UPI003D7BE9A3
MHKGSPTFQIKTLNNKQSCSPTFKQKQINSAWIADYYETELRMNPTWPVNAFHRKIVNDLKCDVSKHAVYRAKRRALMKISEHMRSKTDRGRFMRFYVCLGPLKEAFSQHGRRIIGLDGCHLKGPYGGHLLAAVGVDATDGIYPIAWEIVEAENTDAWNWFLHYFCQDIKIVNDKDWTFISDRQKRLINALESVVPNVEHRFCVMHLFQNMVKEHKSVAQKDLLWKAARASTAWEFNLYMDKMKEVSRKCYEWLNQKPRQQWTRSAFRTTPCSDMFVNNHCEVFNSSIRKKWDLTGIPCYHACACIKFRNDPWEIHVNDHYKKPQYMKLYSYTLEPIAGPEFWEEAPEPTPLPPTIRPQIGRPKKKRNTKNDIPANTTKLSRTGMKMNCKYCKAESHNTRTCYAKKSDEIKKAAEEGREPNIAKTTVSCKTCKKTGHNSRTCSANDRVEAPVQKLKIRRMTRQQGQNDGAEGSKRDEVTTLRQLEAAKRKKVGKKDNMAARPGWRI